MRDRLLPTMLLSLAAFAVVSTSALYFGTLRKALPFPNQDRLELIYGSSQQLASNRAPTSYEDWRDVRRDAQRWEDIALSRTTSFGFEQDARTVLLAAARVTSNLPAVLGIRLHAGSGFVGKPGEEAEDQAIISHRIWRSAFAGRDVIGTRHRIGGADRTIVGVLPPDARYPEPETDVWIPLRPAGPELQRNFRFARAVGLRRANAGHEVASEELRTLAADLERRFPDDNAGFALESVPMLEALLGGYRNGVTALLAVAALLIVLALVNVSGLAASRVLSRRNEIALRRALGAGPIDVTWSVARWLAWPTAIACIVATVAAIAMRQAFPATGGIADTMLESGGGVLPWLFGIATAASLWIVGSIAPALLATRTPVSAALRGGSKGASHQKATLVAVGSIATVQVMLAAIAAVAGIAAVSVAREFQRTELGLQGSVSTKLLAPLTMPNESLEGLSLRVDAAAQSLRALPGVRAAGILSRPPLLDGVSSMGVEVAGSELAGPQSNATADIRLLAGDAAQALGIPLLEGRQLAPGDSGDAEPVVVIDELFKARYFSGVDAIGRQVKFSPPLDRLHTVVGVVGSVQLRQVSASREPAVYIAAAQFTAPAALRTPWAVIDGAAVTPAQLARALASVHGDIAVGQLESVEDRARRAKRPTIVASGVLGAEALLAMLIGLAGCYAALGYAAALREREVGIRRCLGATSAQVFNLLALRGAGYAALGTITGLALGFAGLTLANALDGRVPLALGSAGILALGGIVAFASALIIVAVPAWGGTRVQASAALRG